MMPDGVAEAAIVSQLEMEAQAAMCGVAVAHGPNAHGDAALAEGGRRLLLRGRQPRDGLNCLQRWATGRQLNILVNFE